MSWKKRSEMTPDELERFRARKRDYYHRNRERLCAKQREYYRKRGKAYHAERIKRYRHSDMERTRAKQREYRAAHRERISELNRRYYKRCRYRRCRNTLERYIPESIERFAALCPERAEEYMRRWPYELYADAQIRRQLRRMRLSPANMLYDDCVDAGMLAYLYSIYRCAYMRYEHTEQYIRKMIRVLVICALSAGREAEAICAENGFTRLKLDCDEAAGRF